MLIGTPAYMAPEQISGDGQPASTSCDIYCLGVILYELLTGRRPFQATTLAAMRSQVLMQEPLPPSAHQPDVDSKLGEICLKALAKKVADRYGTMAELAKVLSEYLLIPNEVFRKARPCRNR